MLEWDNHGKYVSCVAQTASSFVKAGLLGAAAKTALVSKAAESECGQNRAGEDARL